MKPQKYEEKCDVQTLILLTPTHKSKLKQVSEKLEKPSAQVIRDLIEKEFDKLFGK